MIQPFETRKAGDPLVSYPPTCPACGADHTEACHAGEYECGGFIDLDPKKTTDEVLVYVVECEDADDFV